MECKFCHESYVPIRSDQEFCTQKCRFDYHNAEAKKIRDRCKETLGILHNNLAILDELLLHRSERIVKYERIKEMGYKINYFTNLETRNKITYNILFDIQLEVLNEQQIKLTRI